MERRTPPNEALADYQRRNCGGCEHADAELVGTGEPCCNRTWQDCEHRRRQREANAAADHDRLDDEAVAKWKAEAGHLMRKAHDDGQHGGHPDPECDQCASGFYTRRQLAKLDADHDQRNDEAAAKWQAEAASRWQATRELVCAVYYFLRAETRNDEGRRQAIGQLVADYFYPELQSIGWRPPTAQ